MRYLSIICSIFLLACTSVDNSAQNRAPFSEVYSSPKTEWGLVYIKGLEEEVAERGASSLATLMQSPRSILTVSVHKERDSTDLRFGGCNSRRWAAYGIDDINRIVAGFSTMKSCMDFDPEKQKAVPSSREVMGGVISSLMPQIRFMRVDLKSGDLLLLDDNEETFARFSFIEEAVQ